MIDIYSGKTTNESIHVVMFRGYVIFYFTCLAPFFSSAQQDIQTSILTENGIMTLSQTPGGNDMVICKIDIWNKIVKGTKYTADNLSVSGAARICIQIANKKQMHCRSGIGFSCGIFDCLKEKENQTVIINNKRRICPVLVQKNTGGTVTIIFLNKVDWQSLQNDN